MTTLKQGENYLHTEESTKSVGASMSIGNNAVQLNSINLGLTDKDIEDYSFNKSQIVGGIQDGYNEVKGWLEPEPQSVLNPMNIGKYDLQIGEDGIEVVGNFGNRALENSPFGLMINSKWQDDKNINFSHEQYFYDDGDSTGYSKGGVIRNENMQNYKMDDSKTYDDTIMREAEQDIKSQVQPYQWHPFGGCQYNCQDYSDSLRQNYNRIDATKNPKVEDRGNQNVNVKFRL